MGYIWPPLGVSSLGTPAGLSLDIPGGGILWGSACNIGMLGPGS